MPHEADSDGDFFADRLLLSRLRLTLEAAQLGLWDWDVVTDTLVWDDRSVAMYGMVRAEMTGTFTDVEDRVHPADLPEVARLLDRAVATAGVVDVEFRVVRPGGEVRRLYARGQAVTDGHGRVVRLIGTNLDVTEARRADQERSAGIAASERRFRLLVEHAADVVQIYDAAGRTTYTSPAQQPILGYRAEQLQGRHYRDLVDPSCRDLADGAFAAAVAEPGASQEVDLRVAHRDGSPRWLSARVTSRLAEPDLQGVVVNWRDVTTQRDLKESLEQQALHDPLTGLPNRRLFGHHLERALAGAERSGHSVTVVFCDVDEFKLVNDTLGHSAGDQLLTEVSCRLRSAVRPGDTVARFGGDEFVLLCEQLQDDHTVGRLLGRVLGAVSGSHRVEGRNVNVGLSLGAATSTGGTSAETLMSQADTALYEAKRRGRNRAEVFDSRLSEAIRHRVETEAGLRRALAGSELTLMYQPLFSLATGQLKGVEALVRWDDPLRGQLLPAQFLGIAEEAGLIVEIGDHVLRAVCAQGARWARLGCAPGSLQVNLSPRELAHPRLLASIDALLLDSHVEPSLLEVEVTETVLLSDLEATKRLLSALRERGIRVALDDFGTGYSSLTWLQQLPADTVKLDRSFISQLTRSRQDVAIVSAVIELAHALGMRVVGEGVEHRDELEMLAELGCDDAQGFLLSPPVPADEVCSLRLEPVCRQPVPDRPGPGEATCGSSHPSGPWLARAASTAVRASGTDSAKPCA